ncbi:MAG TPA: MFS transporter, partial [Bryobacteraceae bacterium]|nr:MFS transporter [Bryobacteraceae bacterium]
WSIANMLTALASGARSLGVFRFLLGLGEAGNYTAAPKAVGEWFDVKQRGLAVGIYTAGAMVGATIAPPLIAFLAMRYGWRWAFVTTGLAGVLWIVPWLLLYHGAPQRAEPAPPAAAAGWAHWRDALSRRSVWLLIVARMLTDPVWYFYLFWFPKYLTDVRGLSLAELGAVSWFVYLAADAGSLAGGWVSGYLIGRGAPAIASRRRVMTAAALMVPAGAIVATGVSLTASLALGALVAFSHLTWQVTMGALIVDLYPPRIMATLFGIIAAGSGFGGMLSTQLVGYAVTNLSWTPVFASMALLHPAAALLIRYVQPSPDSPEHA